MKLSRRAALGLMVGSGSLLAVETLGFSSGSVERDMHVDVVDDADAYLGLVESEDGVASGGLLFESDEARTAPARFDVLNQLAEPVEVALESDAFAFDPVDGSGRVLTDDGDPEIAPGEAVTGVTVELADPPDDGTPVDGTMEIDASGESTVVEAERTLALAPGLAVGSALVDVSRTGGDAIEHRWRLEDVTIREPLERVRFDYRGVATETAIDVTEREDLGVSLLVDGETREATIVRTEPKELVASVPATTELEGDGLVIAVTDAGLPASLGGGTNEPGGATLTLVGAETVVSVEGLRNG